MAGVSDFLSNGATIPAGSALTATRTSSALPAWYDEQLRQLIANQQAVAATPYATAPMPRIAEFAPAQVRGMNMTEAAAGAYQPALGAATTATQNTMGQTASAPAQPYFTQAGGMSGVTAAQPYMEAAGGDVTDVSAYMNPYTNQIVDRIGELGARNLQENLLPALASKYITAGQLGYGPRGGGVAPSGMMTDTARALRDVNADILGRQSEALQTGYSQAQTAMQADLQRKANLANTAGTLTANQQKILTDLGVDIGNLTGEDLTRTLNAANQLASLGGLTQKYGLEGAAAVTGVGAQQQGQAQKNLDVAYQDYLAQKGYPQEQIDKMLGTLKGIGQYMPTTTEKIGVEPSGTQQPSTASTIAGVLTGLGGVLSTLKGP